MESDSDSSLSSDEALDEQTSNMITLADLLWRKSKDPAKATKTEESIQSRASTSKPEPQTQTQMASKPRENHQPSKVDFADLFAKSSKGKSEQKPRVEVKPQGKSSDSLTPLIQSRIEKDLKKIKVKSGPEITEWQKKKNAKLERSQWSLGKEGWGSMRMVEMTEERKQDLMVLNMRSTIDPTRHYKHNDLKTPKFFQIGTVQEDHYGFYHDRIPKKKRKRTLVDELMADQEFKSKLKKQYKEVQSTKAKGMAVFQGRAPRKIKKKKKVN